MSSSLLKGVAVGLIVIALSGGINYFSVNYHKIPDHYLKFDKGEVAYDEEDLPLRIEHIQKHKWDFLGGHTETHRFLVTRGKSLSDNFALWSGPHSIGCPALELKLIDEKIKVVNVKAKIEEYSVKVIKNCAIDALKLSSKLKVESPTPDYVETHKSNVRSANWETAVSEI